MLLDAIIWLPTLFTYIVFLLILIILFFIVAYVSHKIYISIYDNLPLPAAPVSRSTLVPKESTRSDLFGTQTSSRSIWIQNRSQIFDSTVVRITLTLEPCYLVSVGLDIYQNPQQRAVSFLCNCRDSVEMQCAAALERDANCLRILKYYDHMSKVPRLKLLLRCCERNNMRLVLDDVIKDVMEARCTLDHNATACRLPKQRVSNKETE
ncbi:hypothetical protein ACLKA7_017455 [Drosophila subpalustris]